MRTKVSLVLAVALCLGIDAGAQGKRAMTLVDMLEIPQIGEPQLSPDGAQLLFVQGKADWKSNNRVSHIWRSGVDGSGLVQMTNGARGEREPRWSPDGTQIAFLARRTASGTGGDESGEGNQLFLIPSAGGEARQLTQHGTAVSSIAWSPAGDALYFLAADAKTAEEREREKLKDDVYAFDEDYKQTHLWRVAVADGKERRLTDGAFSVLSFKVSRDGSRIVLMRGPTPLIGDRELAEVHVMSASGGESRQLTRNGVGEGGVELSPDNTQVLFTADASAQFEDYHIGGLFVVPAEGGTARMLLPDFPHDVESASWSADGRSIYMLCNMGVHSELFELDVASRKPRQITSGDHGLASWSAPGKSGRHAFTLSTPSMPDEVHVLGIKDTAPVRVTRATDYIARDFKLPREEKIQWKGADGVTVEGILTYPLDYETGKRYPLAVYSHGGPRGSDKLSFSSWREYRPVLAAKGYAVVRSNYRGSTGYGNAFLREMIGHYFGQAHRDVLAGVDHLVAKGIADPDRLVKFGWSAGGHMTNKLITFTDRFKAASSGAGAANWVSMYAQSDMRSHRTPWFGGTPWQKDAPIAVYWDNSPLKDVWKVKTPTIFLVGEKDVRVPSPQAVEMYRALKSNGVPTRLYIAPREPHGWLELRHELFKMNVELEWFEKHALKRAYSWEKAPGEAPKPAVTGGGR